MLKAVTVTAAACLALSTAVPAQADPLLTGVIRDQTGSSVAHARVTALDGAGRSLGTDLAAADGTFAITARAAPASIAIDCDYCRASRVPVDPGEPVVAIVERFTALTGGGPSAADIRALPYRSAGDIATLRPFSVVDDGRITDRGLDRDAAVLVDGLPFYRAADGGDLTALVPAHATAALTIASPLAAPLYGGYADAGIADVRLRDPDVAPSRIDLGDAGDFAASAQTANVGATYAASSDVGNDRQAASAGADVPLDGGRLSFSSLAMSDSFLNASGAGLTYATDSRRFTTAASLSATQSNAGSLLTLGAHLSNHGPLGVTFGVRAMRATSCVDDAGATQFEGALYAAAVRQMGSNRTAANVAWDTGGNAGIPGGARSAGLIGSLADDLDLGPRWTLHAGAVSDLRIPTFGELSAAGPFGDSGDRSSLFEETLTYTDLRRLHVSELVYTQRATGSATRHDNGIGVDAAWQIAPRLSLRTWLLRANQSAVPQAYSTAPYDYVVPPSSAAPLTRQLIWLSYEKYVRVDALIRSGALEGDVRLPLGASYAFSIGTAQYDGRRVTTFGLTRR